VPEAPVFAVFTLSLCVACGAASDHDGAGGSGGSGVAGTSGSGGGSTGGSSGSAGSGGSSGECAGFVPKASPAEVASTPRPAAAAEALAIETSGEFVAPAALYERVVSELSKIVAVDPSMAGIAPMSEAMSNRIIVGFDDPGFQRYQAGSYDAWACPNQAYAATEIATIGSGTLKYVTIAFGPKRYNTPLLASEYAGLPNITSASADSLIGDGSDVCLEIQGSTHFYIFDRAGGDCPAGCTEHLYTAFELPEGGAVQPLGSFDPALPAAPPEWFSRLMDCRTRL
jgi:hypothetical protein